MSVIGTWVQQLTLDATQFHASLTASATAAQAAKGHIESSFGQIKKTATATVRALTGIDFTTSVNAFTPVIDAAKEAYASLGTGVVGHSLAMTAAIAAVGTIAFTSMKSISSLAGTAKRMGADFANLRLVMTAGEMRGLDTSTTQFAMDVLSRKIGAMREGLVSGHLNEDAQSLRRLGLSVEGIAQMPVDQAMAAIITALGSVKSSTDRAAIAQHLFGRQSRELLPLLSAGKDALDQAQAAMTRFNTAVSSADAAKIQAAVRETKIAGGAVTSISTSLGNSLALAFAPLVSGMSRLVAQAVEWLQPLLDVVRDVIKMFGGLFTVISDVASGVVAILSPVIQTIGAVFRYVWGLIRDAVQSVIDSLVTLTPILKIVATVLLVKWVAGFWVIGLAVTAITAVVWGLGKALQAVAAVLVGLVDAFRFALGLILYGVEAILQGLAYLPNWLGGGWAETAAGHVRKLRDEIQGVATAAGNAATAQTDAARTAQAMADFSRRNPNLRGMEFINQFHADQQTRAEEALRRLNAAQVANFQGAMFSRDQTTLMDYLEGVDRSANRAAEALQAMRRTPLMDMSGMQGQLLEAIKKQTDELQKQARYANQLNEHARRRQQWVDQGVTQGGTQNFVAYSAELRAYDASVEMLRVAEGQADTYRSLHDLRMKLETMHMTEAQANIFRLRHSLDKSYSESDLRRRQHMEELLGYEKMMADLRKRSAQIVEQGRSPAEKAQEDLIDLFYQRSLGTLTGDEHGLAVFRALEPIMKAAEANAPRSMLQGSTEAASAITQASRLGDRADPMEALLRVQRDANEQRAEQLRIARRFEAALQDGVGVPLLGGL